MTDGFKFSPDILARLGEELVPDADQGIVELAKNAYDADASVCKIKLDAVHTGHGKITISDNGIGMTETEIRDGWLVIGRSSKQEKPLTSLYGRTPAGDKGLGRLAALRLGQRVTLRTRPRANPGVEHRLTIDWNAFSKVDHVEDVGIELETLNTESTQGTDVIIENVSEHFSRSSVNKLARSLILLSDPFQNELQTATEHSYRKETSELGDKQYLDDPGFIANLETPEFADLQTKVAHSYFTDAQYRIRASVEGDGRTFFRLLDWKGETLNEEAIGLSYKVPPLTFDLWVFLLDTKSFSTRSSTVGEVRDWLSHVGGVHIYESGIRVPPYGGAGNDWLEMNLRRVRSPEGRPSTNNSIGRVYLSNADGLLVQKTDRNGYIENEPFTELKRVCEDALNWAARIQIRERDQKLQAEKAAATKSTANAKERLNKVLSQTVKVTERQTVERAVEKLLKDSGRETKTLRDELQLYRALATAGMTSAVFAHEIGRPLSLIDTAIDGLQRLIPEEKKAVAEKRINRIATAKQRLNSFVSIPLTLLAKRKRRAGRICLNTCLKQLVDLLKPIADEFKVRFELNLSQGYTDINGSEGLIDGICLNLILNSLNAFQRDGHYQSDRVIRLKTRSATNDVILEIEDNAGGIDGVEIGDIWLPGVTTSPEGTGFGLTIVRDSVTDLGGSIDVIPKTEFGGAQFTIYFSPMRTLFQ